MYKPISTDKIRLYCSMNKQYAKGVQKREKFYLMNMDNKLYSKLYWLYCSIVKQEIRLYC